MLIRRAEVDRVSCDLRIVGGKIAAMAPELALIAGETIIDAGGAAIIPGLRDHHLHLYGLGAAVESISCGPPLDERALADALISAASAGAPGWIRGVGYHESVAGDVDRDWLDAHVSDVPVRIQHRSGRLWMLNSCAIDRLRTDGDREWPFETRDGRPTGRLHDADGWLRARRPAQRPDLTTISHRLARRGIVGVTDASHSNDLSDYRAIGDARRAGSLLQDVLAFGTQALDAAPAETGLRPGCLKIHLHDNDLPDPDDLRRWVAAGCASGRGVAVHCVTVADLVVTLRAFDDVGMSAGCRIEHGALIPPDVVEWIADLGLTVVTQPHFIRERGDSYRRDVDVGEQPWLYRAGSLLAAGIRVAAGSDAPYGKPDPWRSMENAVDRRTSAGHSLGASEAITPEQALALYASPLDAPGTAIPPIRVGAAADLCVLDRPWAVARRALGDVDVKVTLKNGEPIWIDPALASALVNDNPYPKASRDG